jgi:GST-like protein
MFQMANIGPMLGQAHHFRHYAKDKNEYGIERYTKESARLYAVMDKRLGESAYLAGREYTIADIAAYPWVRRHERHGIKLEDYREVKRWYDGIDARPAVQLGIKKTDDAKAAL